jgi:hypothetical protein
MTGQQLAEALRNSKALAKADKDIRNTKAWAEVIGDLLRLIPLEQRAAVLALTAANDEAARKEAEANDGFLEVDFTKDWTEVPGLVHWDAIMRLKSLVVQVFVRNIKTNHSPAKAAELLFTRHPYGHGSRSLQDYLPEPPPPGDTTKSIRHSRRGANPVPKSKVVQRLRAALERIIEATQCDIADAEAAADASKIAHQALGKALPIDGA